MKRGLIARNPQDNTIRPNVPPYEPVVLTPEQISAYLEDARETATPALYALYALYVTATTCGLRIGELTGILETDVDLRGRVLHVRQTLVRAGATPVFGRPKTTSGTRTVVLPDLCRGGYPGCAPLEEGATTPPRTEVSGRGALDVWPPRASSQPKQHSYPRPLPAAYKARSAAHAAP